MLEQYAPSTYALRTAPCVTAPASATAFPPTMPVPHRTPRSLSLGSLIWPLTKPLTTLPKLCAGSFGSLTSKKGHTPHGRFSILRLMERLMTKRFAVRKAVKTGDPSRRLELPFLPKSSRRPKQTNRRKRLREFRLELTPDAARNSKATAWYCIRGRWRHRCAVLFFRRFGCRTSFQLFIHCDRRGICVQRHCSIHSSFSRRRDNQAPKETQRTEIRRYHYATRLNPTTSVQPAIRPLT